MDLHGFSRKIHVSDLAPAPKKSTASECTVGYLYVLTLLPEYVIIALLLGLPPSGQGVFLFLFSATMGKEIYICTRGGIYVRQIHADRFPRRAASCLS